MNFLKRNPVYPISRDMRPSGIILLTPPTLIKICREEHQNRITKTIKSKSMNTKNNIDKITKEYFQQLV